MPPVVAHEAALERAHARHPVGRSCRPHQREHVARARVPGLGGLAQPRQQVPIGRFLVSPALDVGRRVADATEEGGARVVASVLDSSIDQSPRQTMVSVGVVDLRVDAGKNIEDEISE